jgi:hypothetical protein
MSGSGMLPAVSTDWSRFGFELTMGKHSARCSTLEALADHLAFA